MFSSLYWERLERCTQLLSIPWRLILQRMLCWDLLIEEGKQVSHDNDHGPLKGHNYLVKLMSSFYTRVELWRGGKNAHHEWKQPCLKTVSHLGCDLLVVDMRSRKRSLGNSGFSSPLKYSFRTPATELMSWSLWSSTRGSSPAHTSHIQLRVTDHMAIHSAFVLQWSDAFMHLQKMACTSINMGSLRARTCAVGQVVSPEVNKCNLKSIKRRRQGTNLFQMHF